MLNTILEKIHKAGLPGYATAFTAGMYYDGTQHGKTFDCIRVVDSTKGIDLATIENELKKIMRYYPSIEYKYLYHPYWNVYTIARKSDFDEAEQLDRISKAWLDAFWMDLHLHPEHRENDSKQAIDAANKAISNAA